METCRWECSRRNPQMSTLRRGLNIKSRGQRRRVSQTPMSKRPLPGPNVVIMRRTTNLSNRWAGPSRSRNFTTSPKSPVNPSGGPATRGADRELMEWKKVKFMQDRVGEDFDGLITSVTKFGFFVELSDLFVEGLVPLNTLTDDRYTYHESTREIIGQHSRKIYRMGQRIRVLVDRIDPVEKKIQFAVFEEPEPRPAAKGTLKSRKRR